MSRVRANLQPESDASIPDPGDPTKRILSGDEIKWLWHRIEKAAVVRGDIEPGPALDSFRIPVEPDVSFRFSVGDTVRLRKRAWGVELAKARTIQVSGDLVITEPPQPDLITVRAVHVISAQAFPPGSLLYVPKPAPASVASATYPFAEMVAKNVKDAITANREPLQATAGPNDTPQVPRIAAEPGWQAVDHPVIDAKDHSRIVGLYAGGGTAASGIFHPTGMCMMRNNLDSKAEFCAICRYVMIDFLAPEFHPEIDRDYERYYPQK
jgi:hypothetical protein